MGSRCPLRRAPSCAVLKPREWPATLAEAFHCTVHDNCFILAKAASYSAALSLFPGLIFVTALLFRNNAAETLLDVAEAIGYVLPPQVQLLLSQFLTVEADRSTIVLATAGAAAVLFSSDVMGTLMEGFRMAYRSPRRASLWREYGVAVLLVFLSIIPLTAANASLILSRQIESRMSRLFGERWWIVESLQLRWWVIALATFTVILSVLYYVAPNRRQRWRDVWPGAALAAMLWAPMTALFTLYVQSIARYREFYGNISTVIVLLIWTYLASVIVLFGCEVNAARERRLGTLPARPIEDH